MQPALSTAAVEREYETYGGKARTVTYWHWGQHRQVTVKVTDPGRRKVKPKHDGYSPLRRSDS